MTNELNHVTNMPGSSVDHFSCEMYLEPGDEANFDADSIILRKCSPHLCVKVNK